jgi:hypothetical protein
MQLPSAFMSIKRAAEWLNMSETALRTWFVRYPQLRPALKRVGPRRLLVDGERLIQILRDSAAEVEEQPHEQP